MENKNKKEDDLYLRKAELGELFDTTCALDVNLWRGQKPKECESPILYPILKAFKLSNGKTRPADIKTYMKSNELWISSKGGGVSLFDA